MAKLSKKDLAVKECGKFQQELDKITALINEGKYTVMELGHGMKVNAQFNDFLKDNREVLDDCYLTFNNSRLESKCIILDAYKEINEETRNKKLFDFSNNKLSLISGFRLKKGVIESIPAVLDLNSSVFDTTMLPFTVKLMAYIGYSALYESTLSDKKEQENLLLEENEKYNEDKYKVACYTVSLLEGENCKTNYLDILYTEIVEMAGNILKEEKEEVFDEDVTEYINSCSTNLLKGFVASTGFKSVKYEVFEGVYTLVATLKDYMTGGNINYAKKFHNLLEGDIFARLRQSELAPNPLFNDIWIKDRVQLGDNKEQRFSRALFCSCMKEAITHDKKSGKEKNGEIKKEEYFSDQIVKYIRQYSR